MAIILCVQIIMDIRDFMIKTSSQLVSITKHTPVHPDLDGIYQLLYVKDDDVHIKQLVDAIKVRMYV